MRRLGADCSVVVTKRGNARGAKGAGHRHELGSTGSYREEPECFSGRRQPSCDGTSRMTRECHVRICERLGVRFPGPTRHKATSAKALRWVGSTPPTDIRAVMSEVSYALIERSSGASPNAAIATFGCSSCRPPVLSASANELDEARLWTLACRGGSTVAP